MEDRQIVALYQARDEQAVSETAVKYGGYLYRISYGILGSEEDAKECVNDAYREAWQAIPPHDPSHLSAFLGKIVRRISVDALRKRTAEKRGGGEAAIALDELEECVSGDRTPQDESERAELRAILNDFLRSLPKAQQQIFLSRYWYLEPVSEIAARFGYSESKTASILHRVRKKLRERLEKENYL